MKVALAADWEGEWEEEEGRGEQEMEEEGEEEGMVHAQGLVELMMEMSVSVVAWGGQGETLVVV